MKDDEITALSGNNAQFLEEMYQLYKTRPDELPHGWKNLFHSLEDGSQDTQDKNIQAPQIETKSEIKDPAAVHTRLDESAITFFHELGLNNLLNLYRRQGHLAARLDPLGIKQPQRKVIDEKIAYLSVHDLAREFESPFADIPGRMSLARIIEGMEEIYCSTTGYETYYLVTEEERRWLQSRIENLKQQVDISRDVRHKIFQSIFQGDYFEKFLAKKYVGKKRFSLEGGESLLIMLDTIITRAGDERLLGVVIGMAHRGRLNVLVNILQKPAGVVFAEFEENIDDKLDSYSDVKYHLGYSNIQDTPSGNKVKVSLAFNPSHLEAVVPVVMGSVRAKQALYYHGEPHIRVKDGQVKTGKKSNPDTFIPVLIHGDASFVGQGVMAESLNLMNLQGFSVGGTIHIVVNNQVGFTAEPEESRSTLYATDLAKGFQIPIFHVNTDDPEAVYRVIKIAFDYRMSFHKDVIIDLICYRRHGHNEMDEPEFTQPLMYRKIKAHPEVSRLYENFLTKENIFQPEEIKAIKEMVKNNLEESFTRAHQEDLHMQAEKFHGVWSEFSAKESSGKIKTYITKDEIEKIIFVSTTMPKEINANPKLNRLFAHRREMAEGQKPVNWGLAETFALGSILLEGYDVRLCGQDTVRGTFSQRHLSVVDVENGEIYIPLNNLAANQGFLEVINSSLSEFSVLGFEYGYSFSNPLTLVIWEAQYGDFVNGAQVIIDQFIASSEIKWFRYSGLVLLLPHGYEGQGPEHSSARLERFLQLCANDNLQICNVTTAAQYFHLLRRQMLRPLRKPLIIFSPKSLLRYNDAGSHISAFSQGVFHAVLDDERISNPEKVKRILFSSGKIYYDMLNHLNPKEPEEASGKTIEVQTLAMVRLEELYPFPVAELQRVLKRYPNAREFFWCQEEPENQGGWFFIKDKLSRLLPGEQPLGYIGRPESASTATGLNKVHFREFKEYISKII
jgi:2-oxoglutarate dehydrogenase E1 component